MEKESKLGTKIIESLKEIIQDSTSHGIPRIIKSKTYFMKLIWTLAFLGSTSFCIYLISNTICDYLSFDYNTRIETLTEIPCLFPVIVICNLNLFSSNNSIDFIKEFYYNNSNIQSFPNYQQSFYILSDLLLRNDSFKNSMSLNLNETLISCSFNGNTCDSNHFEWMFDVMYGNCYKFNTGSDYFGKPQNLGKQSNPGSINGLRLELSIGNPDQVPNFMPSTGYHVMVRNQSIPFILNDGLNVATGTETNVIINKVFTYRLAEPYNDCLSNLDKIDSFDSTLFRAIINSNSTYRQTECFNLCYQTIVIKQCKCYLSSFDKLYGIIPCQTMDQINCSKVLFEQFLKSDIAKTCSADCPQECDSTSLPFSVSFSAYPSKSYAMEKLMNNSKIKSIFSEGQLTYDLIKQSALALNVFYDHLAYTEITQQTKMQIFDIISNVGGLLGLFIGISFLSVIEIFEIIFEIFFILFQTHNERKIMGLQYCKQ